MKMYLMNGIYSHSQTCNGAGETQQLLNMIPAGIYRHSLFCFLPPHIESCNDASLLKYVVLGYKEVDK